MRNLRFWSRRGVALLAGAALLLTACGSGASAATMRLTRAQGQVNVSDDAGEEVALLENLGLYSGYGVDTRRESYAWINLDDVKLTKMDQESEIVIQKEGKKLEIEVRSGSLFFNVTEPLAEDETMDIRTSTMGVGIRGTCGWVTENAVALLEGTVSVTAGEQTVTVGAGEMAVLTPAGTLEVKKLSAEDIPAFVREEAADSGKLQEAIQAIGGEAPAGPEDGGTDAGGDGAGGQNPAAAQEPVFVPWDEAGLEDHVMDWKDEALAAAMAEETGITDREIMLSDVWEMQYVWLSSKNISDISALGELTNLTNLHAGFNGISDISALANLKNLTFLDLGHNPISDISALAGLTNLATLEMVFDDISDISPLAGLTNLERLWLENNNISDISALASLTSLTDLQLRSNNISDVSALAGLTNLTSLELERNNISDVSALAGLTNLNQLYLEGNPISDYSPVEFVEYLRK